MTDLEVFDWKKAQSELKAGKFIARYIWNKNMIEGIVSRSMASTCYIALNNKGEMITETSGGGGLPAKITADDEAAIDWYSIPPITVSVIGMEPYAPYVKVFGAR